MINSLIALTLIAQPVSEWETGPIIIGHGPHAPVDVTMPVPQGTVLRHAFDTVKLEEDGTNRTLQSAARFINMHAAAGVPADDIQPAVILHSRAVFAVVSDERFAEHRDSDEANPNRDLVEKLLTHGVRIIVCGQSAAALEVGTDDLIPGVEMALSAMTAHALLQQEGYTLNPF